VDFLCKGCSKVDFRRAKILYAIFPGSIPTIKYYHIYNDTYIHICTCICIFTSICMYNICVYVCMYVCKFENFYSEKDGTTSSLVISTQISRGSIQLPSDSTVKLKFDNVRMYIHIFV